MSLEYTILSVAYEDSTSLFFSSHGLARSANSHFSFKEESWMLGAFQ